MTARIFIDGQAGTTGLSIATRLRAIPGIEILALPDQDRKNDDARLAIMAKADLVVLCLPDDAARQAVALAERLGTAAPKLLDASTAHRLAPGWVYGFAELTRDQPARIGKAQRVANPGCYATGAIALLRPLTEAGLLQADQNISINAVSGYSGGGKSMIADHETSHGPAFELYGLGHGHKHIPEIRHYAGLANAPLFIPSVGHFRQGMLVSIPLFLHDLPGKPRGADIEAAFDRHYAGFHLVRRRPMPADFRLDPQSLNDTDRMEIFVHADDQSGRAILIARLDNLGKGAAGAAVQNLLLQLSLQPAMEALDA